MKHKLFAIKGCDTCDLVVLLLQKGEGYDSFFVHISAYHEDNEIQVTKVQFGDFKDPRIAAETYIGDFSENSANEFANSYHS